MYRYFVLFIILIKTIDSDVHDNKVEDCNLSNELKQEIASYLPTVQTIIDATVRGKYKGFVYDELATFVDKFGNRIAGSENLENAIDYLLQRLKDVKLDNVHGEDVTVPHWVRGSESAAMLEPRYQNLAMLGLGGSIATPVEGLEAEAIVVESFDELERVADKVPKKIVVFNEKYISYGQTVQYRSHAAARSAAHGAVATLVRSVTPFSLNTPHTGWQNYDKNVPKIPTASITVEDANMLERIQKRGDKIVIRLKMEAKTLPSTVSRNTVSELEGSEQKEKVVIVSGHLDSWDVGDGAMDDGGGAFISWGALAVLKGLGLRARRSLRAVLWTAEEEGLVGAQQYAVAHKDETDDWVFVMESDEGTFTPSGLDYSGSSYGACILQEILNLLEPINTTQLNVVPNGNIGSDITIWTENGLPGASLLNANDRYFWYHHTNADTMDVEDSDTLDRATALWASVAFVIANLSVEFPRNATVV